MKLITVNDTARGSVQAKMDKKIIYSISWHPNETKIALVTVNGNLIIYDALKSKLLAQATPIEDQPSYKVAWNQLQPKHILMSSASYRVFLFEFNEKSIKLVSEYKH